MDADRMDGESLLLFLEINDKKISWIFKFFCAVTIEYMTDQFAAPSQEILKKLYSEKNMTLL